MKATMMRHMMVKVTILFVGASIVANVAHAGPGHTNFVPPEIAIQGKLELGDGSGLAGTRNFVVRFFDAETSGTQIGMDQLGSADVSAAGRFSIILTPSSALLGRSELWYELGIDSAATPDGTVGAEDVFPARVQVTSVPFALDAGHLAGVSASEYVTGDQLTTTTSELGGNTFWRLGGNTITSGTAQTIGPLGNQPFEVHVNGKRVMQLAPTATFFGPNVLLGDADNTIDSGIVGATIGGGGGALLGNRVAGNLGTVSGGVKNTASGEISTIGGGENNIASGDTSTIGGGSSNVTSGIASTVAGGIANQVIETNATIAGGRDNITSASESTIGGGRRNRITISGIYSTISGGSDNQASDAGATVGGGEFNASGGSYSTVAGGGQNQAQGWYSSIGGGALNQALGESSTVAGGDSNVTNGNFSAVGGGSANVALGDATTISGGSANQTKDEGATIAGGWTNIAVGRFSTIAGGQDHITTGWHATIGGGQENQASGSHATIGGGWMNQATDLFATVAGGSNNQSTGFASMVPGGEGNLAGGNHSLAAGMNAKAVNHGTFVWADNSSGADFTSTADYQFLIRAGGGVGIGTATTPEQLTVNGNTLVQGDVKIGSDDALMFTGNSARYGQAASFDPSATQTSGLILEHSNQQVSESTGIYMDQDTLVMWSPGDSDILRVYDEDDLTLPSPIPAMVLDNAGYLGLNVSTTSNHPVHVGTTTSDGNGAFLSTGGVWTDASDRETKEGFEAVDGEAVLEKVAGLPVTEWSYKGQGEVRHIGPVAQDFHAAFGVGEDDRHIASLDTGGVALAAIQGLHARLEAKDEQIRRLEERLAELEAMVRGDGVER